MSDELAEIELKVHFDPEKTVFVRTLTESAMDHLMTVLVAADVDGFVSMHSPAAWTSAERAD